VSKQYIYAFQNSAWTHVRTFEVPNGVGLYRPHPTVGSNSYIPVPALNTLYLADYGNVPQPVPNTRTIVSLQNNAVTLTVDGSATTTTVPSAATEMLLSSGLRIAGNLNVAGTISLSNLSGTFASNNLPLSGVTAGTYGSSNTLPIVSVDAYGRVTQATTVALNPSIPFSKCLGDIELQPIAGVRRDSKAPMAAHLRYRL